MIERGEVIEAGGERKRADGSIPIACVCQRAVNATEAQAKHIVRKRGAFAFEQLVNVTRRHPMPRSDRAGAHVTIRQVRCDVRFDRLHASGANATSAGNIEIVAGGAKRDGNEIVDVSYYRLPQLQCACRLSVLKHRKIIVEQLKDAGIAR